MTESKLYNFDQELKEFNKEFVQYKDIAIKDSSKLLYRYICYCMEMAKFYFEMINQIPVEIDSKQAIEYLSNLAVSFSKYGIIALHTMYKQADPLKKELNLASEFQSILDSNPNVFIKMVTLEDIDTTEFEKDIQFISKELNIMTEKKDFSISNFYNLIEKHACNKNKTK